MTLREHPYLRFATLIAAILMSFGALGADERGQFGRVIRIERDAFLPSAGLIEFHEVELGTRNPVYLPGDYGADPNAVSVSFGGAFLGQRVGAGTQCDPVAAATGCVEGQPDTPLQLDPGAPITVVVRDRSNPRMPSLSGYPPLNGPVAMIFDSDVAGVGLVGGHFDVPRSTAISVFDRAGNLIGGVVNLMTGMEYLALVTDDGSERIAGLQFSLVGAEPAGFGIDDLSFAKRDQLNNERIPLIGDLLGNRKDDVSDPATTNAAAAEAAPADQGTLTELFGNQATHPDAAAASYTDPETPRPSADKTDASSGLRDLFKLER